MNKEIGIRFGALSEPLEVQLKKQGFTDKKLGHHKQVIEASMRLWFGRYIPDSTHKKIEQKVFKDIIKNLVPIEGESHD